MSLNYRPEIDGLRAVAVIAVLIYHANFLIHGKQFLSGGYLGVDVFFVISGYLITLILLKEMHTGNFSYVSFYERRARRILPALFVILVVSTLAAWFLLSPLLLKNYSGSLSSTAVFGSNFFFWNEAGYNAEANEYKPLLHTWSLAVEEQFYIVFPLIIFIVWKYADKYLLAVLSGIFVISLAYASWINQKDANSAFYLITARAWQLMAGALLAHFEFAHGRDQSPLLGKLAPVTGLLMIIGSLFLFNQTTSHPGLLTLIPVTGTMMIIRYTQPNGYFFRTLGNRVVTSIGLISYSLYLWHIPVFSFARIKSQEVATLLDKLDWIGLSLLLATTTYWLVEKPCRNKQHIRSETIWVGSGVGIIAFLAFGLYGHYSDGIPARLSPFIGKIAAAEKRSYLPYSDSGVACRELNISRGKCRFSGKNNSSYTLVTVGDSHIAELNKPIHNRLSTLNAFIPLTHSGCLFVLDLERISSNTRMCETEYNQERLNIIRSIEKPIVIAGGRLPLAIESSRFNNQEGGVEPNRNVPVLVQPGHQAGSPANMNSIKQAFTVTAKQLLENNIKLVLVYPIPEVGWHVPRKLTNMVRGKQFHELVILSSSSPLTTSHKVFKERTRRSYEVYDNISDHENLLRIYPEKLLCANGRCRTHSNNTIYYRDDDHLSYEGADMLVTHIFEEVDKKWGMNIHKPPS